MKYETQRSLMDLIKLIDRLGGSFSPSPSEIKFFPKNTDSYKTPSMHALSLKEGTC